MEIIFLRSYKKMDLKMGLVSKVFYSMVVVFEKT